MDQPDDRSRVAEPIPRRVLLSTGGFELSALLAEPRFGRPRATVVALHGAGVTSAYFDGTAHPSVSLLRLAARLGYAALAIDRPGYGHSGHRFPSGVGVADQAELILSALTRWCATRAAGTEVFLLAHSFGGMVALTMAADPAARLLGVDLSGCGHLRCAGGRLRASARRRASANWGPLRLYPPGTFRAAAPMVAPMPLCEVTASWRWPAAFDAVSARITVPTRFTFAEYEPWWRHDAQAVDDLRTRLPRAPQVLVDHHGDAGHNLSLGWSARSYHLRALGFLEECLIAGNARQSVDRQQTADDLRKAVAL